LINAEDILLYHHPALFRIGILNTAIENKKPWELARSGSEKLKPFPCDLVQKKQRKAGLSN